MPTSTSPRPSRRTLRVAPFVLALLCFLLPFIQVSCHGEKFATRTGVELAVGSKAVTSDPWSGQDQTQKIPVEPYVLTAAILVIVAAGGVFLPKQLGTVIPAAVGGMAIGALGMATLTIGLRVAKEGEGLLEVSYQFGYFGALLFLSMGVLISGVAAIKPTGGGG